MNDKRLEGPLTKGGQRDHGVKSTLKIALNSEERSLLKSLLIFSPVQLFPAGAISHRSLLLSSSALVLSHAELSLMAAAFASSLIFDLYCITPSLPIGRHGGTTRGRWVSHPF